jgi:hypothetical protein
MRVPTALIAQREFRQAHGDKIAANLDLNKLGFPIINHRDGVYWVVDGQHRIYALKEWGFGDQKIPCEVYQGLTDAEMADTFLGRDDRKPIQLFDKFHIAITAGHKRETDIKRVVEANGQKIGRERDSGISAVGALGDVYDRFGETVLGQALRTINLGFAGDPLAFDRSVVEGVALVFNRYNGRTNEKKLGAKLGDLRQGPRELLRKANAVRERTGNAMKNCVASVLVDLNNRGLGPRDPGRLPSWWKE